MLVGKALFAAVRGGEEEATSRKLPFHTGS
jgi:hypothetical protein